MTKIAIHTVIVSFMNGITVKIISLFAWDPWGVPWPHSENQRVGRYCFTDLILLNLVTSLNDKQQLWRRLIHWLIATMLPIIFCWTLYYRSSIRIIGWSHWILGSHCTHSLIISHSWSSYFLSIRGNSHQRSCYCWLYVFLFFSRHVSYLFTCNSIAIRNALTTLRGQCYHRSSLMCPECIKTCCKRC